MAVAIALWSIALHPGEPTEITPPVDLKISNAALDVELADQKSRSSVRLIYLGPKASLDDEDEDEGEPVATILCSLTPGRIEQAVLNVTLEGGQAVAFENIGKNVIYLSGNFIDQIPHDDPPSEDELQLPEDDESFDVDDVSSDVEVVAETVELSVHDDVDMEELPPTLESKKRRLEQELNNDADTSKSSQVEKKKAKKTKVDEGQGAVAISGATGIDKSAEALGGKAEAKPQKEKKKKDDTKDSKKDAQKVSSSARELAGGVKVLDTKIGSGPEAKKGDNVHMRYSGKLEDGTVFDSNMKGKPFKFTLGDGDVIKGWDIGIVGMQAGGERQLTIPPSMGYGKRKQSGIPPSSTLIFDVKLLKIAP